MAVTRTLLIAAIGVASLLGVPSTSFGQDAKATREIKLAVVDVGTKEKAPAAFLDLLTVAFGKQESIALLERADVDRLLREQALSLSLSNPVESAAAVKAGKLWAVDAFLMLAAEKTPKGLIGVRVRLVDAHHGMKVLDSQLLLEADGKKLPEQAEALAKSAALKLAGFKKDAKGIRLVGVAAIQSKEVSKSWDWLSESLAAGLEQHLGLEPSVILMERKETRTLSDERKLADGLPDALKASAVLVTGSFQLERGKGLDTIAVTVQCRSAGKVILERKVEGTLGQPSLIAQKLAKEIAAGLPGGGASIRSMTPEAEAKMLADQARAFFTTQNSGANQSWTNDPEQALAPAEAALALVPTSNEYRYLLLTILNAQLFQHSLEKGTKQFWQHGLRYCARAIPAAEQIIANPDKSLPSEWPHTVIQIFQNHSNCHAFMVFGKQWSDDDEDAAKAVRRGLMALYTKGMALPGYQVNFTNVAGVNGYQWCETPEQALKLRLESVEGISALFKRNPVTTDTILVLPNSSFFPQFSGCPQWAKRRDLETLYAGHLEALCKHKDPVVRLSGELASSAFHVRFGVKPDHEKSRSHFETFVRTLKAEVQPQSPAGAQHFQFWFFGTLVKSRFAADAKKDAEIKAGLTRDMLDYFLADQNRFQQINHWKYSLEFYSLQLETVGKEEEAYRYLQERAKHLKGVKLAAGDNADLIPDLMAKLARKHPSLRPTEDGPNPYKTETVFLLKDLKQYFAKQPWAGGEDVHLRRLFLDGKVAAVVCTKGIGKKERFGLLRLDPDTLKPVSFTEYPVDFETDSKWPLNDYEFEGPPVSAVGADIYVGSPYGGVVCFPAQGPAKGWSEKTGLASNQIRSLAILDGKLYATTGAYNTDRGLIDLDLATGKSAILFSSKTKESAHELDGRLILAVAADAKRQCVWVAARPRPIGMGKGDQGALFAYYPKEQKTLKKMGAERGLEWLVPQQGKLLLGGQMYALAMDLHTEEITPLIDGDVPGYLPFKAPRKLIPGAFGGCRIMLPVGPKLIYRDSRKQDTASLFVMSAGDEKPVSILEKCFPDQPDRHLIHDLAASRQGMLLLTSSGLFVSPGIKSDADARPQGK